MITPMTTHAIVLDGMRGSSNPEAMLLSFLHRVDPLVSIGSFERTIGGFQYQLRVTHMLYRA